MPSDFRYKAVIFDLDGTLIDSLEDLTDAVNKALELRHLPLHTVEQCRTMVGHGVRNLVRNALPEELRGDETLLDACLADFKDWYSSHIDIHTHPYDGIVPLLEDLSDAGVKLSVASNKYQAGVEQLVRKLFPGIRFAALLGNRPGYPLKPDPQIVSLALEASGVSKHNCVMVGDSPTDRRTAANSSVDAIAVSWGYRKREEILSAFPDASIADSVPELRRMIK